LKALGKKSELLSKRLFIDPASISSGWALFEGPKLITAGAIVVDKKLPAFARLYQVYKRYQEVSKRLLVDEVHIEQLVRNTHIYTHFSVAAAGIAFIPSGARVDADIPIQSWQKHCDWKGERAPLKAYQEIAETEDVLAAIGMGLFYLARRA
jgi:hypothetical protein